MNLLNVMTHTHISKVTHHETMGGASADPFEDQIASDDANELFRKLVIILKALQWDIMLPKAENDDGIVTGLVAGTSEYVNKMFNIMETAGQ